MTFTSDSWKQLISGDGYDKAKAICGIVMMFALVSLMISAFEPQILAEKSDVYSHAVAGAITAVLTFIKIA